MLRSLLGIGLVISWKVMILKIGAPETIKGLRCWLQYELEA